MEILQNINYLWLIAGGILIILEFVLMPGIGFLFAGLGAITVGALAQSGIIDGDIWRLVIFLAASIIWTILLWKPLKNFKMKHEGNHAPFSDMVGRKAILISSLLPGETGQIKWSGTIMNAKLDAHVKESVAGGAEVTITRVEGNVAVVK